MSIQKYELFDRKNSIKLHPFSDFTIISEARKYYIVIRTKRVCGVSSRSDMRKWVKTNFVDFTSTK